MEILMKLKCSPSTTVRTVHSHSALKAVDQHNQLLQQQLVPDIVNLGRNPVEHHSTPLHPNMPSVNIPMRQQDLRMPSNCHPMDYSAPMSCCGVNFSTSCTFSHPAQYNAGVYNGADMPCCAIGSFDPPDCCVGRPFTIRKTPPLMPSIPSLTGQSIPNSNPTTLDDCSAPQYEYHEPEENYVSIEDAKVKGLLLKIGQERRKEKSTGSSSTRSREKPCQIIELDDDDDDQKKLHHVKNHRNDKFISRLPKMPPLHPILKPRLLGKSPDISLIAIPTLKQIHPNETHPSSKTANQMKIVAEIDLVESSEESECSEGGNSYEHEKSALVAASVNCELGGSEDGINDDNNDSNDNDKDNDNDNENNDKMVQNDTDAKVDNIIELDSDDENIEFIDEHEEGLEVQWDEFDEQKERNMFACVVCGKKVQSNYNLRRHMMIHTGERPYGCDMCKRRFREFSDLKKHRRRHMHEKNFLCMICRANKPTENDPTRCCRCDTSNEALIAAVPATVNPSVLSKIPAQTNVTKIKIKRQRRSSESTSATIQNNSNSTSPPPLVLLKKGDSPKPLATKVPPPNPPPPLMPIVDSNASDPQPSASSTIVPKTQNDKKSGINTGLVHSRAIFAKNSFARKPSNRKFQCSLCDRSFGTKHNLKRHFMIHTGEKPYSCLNCRKPFREYSTLKKHMITHQRDRWYKCLNCPKKYRDYLEYAEHKRTHRADAKKNGKPVELSSDTNEDDSSDNESLKCDDCGQVCKDIPSYNKHLRLHNNTIFIFECYMCKRHFKDQKKLADHLKQHPIDKRTTKPIRNLKSKSQKRT